MTSTPTQPAPGDAPNAEISLTPRKSRASGPPAWTHPLIYAGVRGACAGTGVLGIERSTRLARSFSGWYAGLDRNAHRLERAKGNLRWCFPDWDEDRVHACAVEAYRHLFTLGVEVMAGPQLIASDAYASYVQIGSVQAGLEELLGDQPCLLVTGHCGNWELLGATMAVLGFPMHALYRPMDIKPLDDWLYRTRAARGIELVDKFGAAQRLPELLEQGESVAFIADQNAGDRGLFVPFFDRLASAYKTIGVMAMRYRAPVICGSARRLSGGIEGDAAGREPASRFRYRIDISDVIRPEDWDEQPDPLFYITARYRRAIELMVREAPEQYLWMHRYWKSRPRHERTGAPFPDRLREKIRSLPWMTDESMARIEQRSAIDAEEYASSGRPRT